jgi:hypothetical protein
MRIKIGEIEFTSVLMFIFMANLVKTVNQIYATQYDLFLIIIY